MDPVAIAITFGAIFLVELPDKTFIAALVLSTRYRPLLVWLGVGLAFFVQTLVAVAAGTLASFLPDSAIKGASAAIFLIGSLVLLRTARGADAQEAEQEAEYADKAAYPRSGLRAVATSFLILFAAEWGDLSQLLTISLVARFDDQVSVFIGAWAALLSVSGLAILFGRLLLRHLRLSVLHYLGGGVCLILASVTAYELLTGS